MIVIADSTPLNYLILIHQVDLLPQLFDRILIPPAVFEELQHPGNAGYRPALDRESSLVAPGAGAAFRSRPGVGLP